MKDTYKLQIGLIVVLALVATALLFSPKSTPDQELLFSLKRAQENTFLKTKSTPASKVDYLSSMLESRLMELQSVVNKKQYGYVLSAASRYSTLAGQITELVVSNNLTDKVSMIKDQFKTHQKVINEIYVIYPKNTDNVEYKYIQDDYNYLTIYLEQLQNVR